MIRKPAVAGQFYPGSPEHLRAFLAEAMPRDPNPVRAVGAVCPHAGYVYSGRVAGAVLGRAVVPETVVLLGPNHTGLGARAAILSAGTWSTPLGPVPLHAELAAALRSAAPLLEEDALAHTHEHALEVLVPFLLYRNPNVRIVPVILSLRRSEEAEELGEALRSVLSSWPEPTLIVASSDMSHYEPQEKAKEKDARAIDRVLALDARGLLDTTRRFGISMCGVVPTAVLLFAASDLGATRAELVAYATSGDVSGDYARVVGYAGMLII